ncbi:MAG TPA: UDP-N-acetylglucosamine acyltransferase [Pseudonocardiaceae bacterium]
MPLVHPTAVIGPDVRLGERVAIGPHAVLVGNCVVGDDCWIGPGVVIGTPPEVAGITHEAGWSSEDAAPGLPGVVIGAGTILREGSMVHRGWKAEATVLGAGCYLMNKVYIAHDCRIADNVTMASTATLGGHVRVGPRANLGMGATVHQFRVVGPGAMVGMGSVVTRDVPPFGTVHGNPARLRGVNRVGMSRAGVADETIETVGSAYAEHRLPDPGGLADVAAEAFTWWGEADPQRPLV